MEFVQVMNLEPLEFTISSKVARGGGRVSAGAGDGEGQDWGWSSRGLVAKELGGLKRGSCGLGVRGYLVYEHSLGWVIPGLVMG